MEIKDQCLPGLEEFSTTRQKYCGIKIIEARPCEKDGKEGYEVVYPDGYVSWSPKFVFETSYFPLEEGIGSYMTKMKFDMKYRKIGMDPKILEDRPRIITSESDSKDTLYETASKILVSKINGLLSDYSEVYMDRLIEIIGEYQTAMLKAINEN